VGAETVRAGTVVFPDVGGSCAGAADDALGRGAAFGFAVTVEPAPATPPRSFGPVPALTVVYVVCGAPTVPNCVFTCDMPVRTLTVFGFAVLGADFCLGGAGSVDGVNPPYGFGGTNRPTTRTSSGR